MDDVVNRLAHELAEAIGTAVAADPKVEACREKARASGYEMQVSLEAVVGFGTRAGSQALAKIGGAEPVPQRRSTHGHHGQRPAVLAVAPDCGR